MDKNIKMSILLDIYGKLLTEKQYNLLNDYYNNDFSQSEIAENEKITRQAVRDNLKKGENNLLEYEENLKIMEKNLISQNKINSALKDIENLKNKVSDKDIKKSLQTIEDKLKN
jgi:predicted DNA-binding protein YlxM (UPF0122 family)